MKFRKKTTFNTHDTKVVKGDNGRIELDQSRGVMARCELVVNALIRFGHKGATGSTIADHVNSRLNSNYSVTDLTYAMNRLVEAGVIGGTSYGRGEEAVYRASQGALNKWRKARRP